MPSLALEGLILCFYDRSFIERESATGFWTKTSRPTDKSVDPGSIDAGVSLLFIEPILIMPPEYLPAYLH